ncbi:SAM-dependent methyltransferase [Afipia sp. P52-10]|uniref:class I SAM-dependent methyltransferase n=1 Tax=Afipia sp. P52-10 TaxID=1429916 RepID=UPI0003DF054F|nr:class I SAM-dependent methyltransferase [Afipia sp. P52-10]ETR77659.1 SAM-dependent methyltransferase [Afipia sp. P52-10]
MTQNIYDDPDFFAGYSQFPRSIDGLEGAAEWPSMRALLPDLQGLSIVDLGCGFGWFCRFAREHGAAHILGLDVSERMLAKAQAMTADAHITYRRADLETLALPEQAFDLAYSSLALHYVVNLDGLLAAVHRALKPGGRLVVSIEHPIYMAPSRPDWIASPTGQRVWPLDRYLVEGPRTTDWITSGIVKQHRTLGTTLNLLIRHGFSIAHVEEWGPTDAEITAHPDWAEVRDRPMFLLIAAHC